jgi:hypothetical protein
VKGSQTGGLHQEDKDQALPKTEEGSMKTRIATVLLLLVSAAMFAAAQSSSSIVVDVPFAFHVGGKVLPAGTYRILPGSNLSQITVATADGKNEALVPVMTRLSQRSEKESIVVFDVSGENHYMTEIYISGLDGFQIQGAPGKHSHASVKGK